MRIAQCTNAGGNAALTVSPLRRNGWSSTAASRIVMASAMVCQPAVDHMADARRQRVNDRLILIGPALERALPETTDPALALVSFHQALKRREPASGAATVPGGAAQVERTFRSTASIVVFPRKPEPTACAIRPGYGHEKGRPLLGTAFRRVRCRLRDRRCGGGAPPSSVRAPLPSRSAAPRRHRA